MPESSESLGWSGAIVARILKEDIESDYDQTRKPHSQRISPSSLVPGTGRLGGRPSVPFRILHGGESGDDLTKWVPTTTTTDPPGGSSESAGSSVRLDVSLFPPTNHSDDESSTNDIQQLVLTRECDEDITKCLHRLGLSIAKKFRGKKHVKGKKQRRKADSSGVSCTVIIQGETDPMDITTGMSNREFWRLASQKSITIEVSMDSLSFPLYVESNPPTVLGISTFEKFDADLFPGIPILVQVETIFADRAIVDWYADATLVCQDSPLYIPTEAETQKELAVLVTPFRPGHDGAGCQEAYLFSQKVAPSRPENTVLSIRPYWRQSRDSANSNNKALRVLSYNILADQNAFSGPNREPFFPWVSADLLNRSRRMPLILHEILAYQADIICLQEVDQLVFDTLLLPMLEHYNYQGFFSVKQTDGNQEGCALFWSLDRFERVDSQNCKTLRLGNLLKQYENPIDDDPDWKPHVEVISELFQNRPDLLDIITSKLGHVVQMAHLCDLNGNPLLISNTHLFFHPVAPHIRLLQLFAIAHQLTKEQQPLDTPFIMCGDMNTSLNNCAALLMNRYVPKNYRDYRECLNRFDWDDDDDGQREQRGFDGDFPEIRLPDSFPALATAYPDRPDFTHYIIGFNATLDHILMTSKTSTGRLSFLRQAEMPTVEQVTRDQAMPGPAFPSDHVAVLAELIWNPVGTNE